MQRVRISDAVRCLLLNVPNGPNLVCPSESLPDGGDLRRSAIWRDALAQPKDRVTLLSWNGMHLDGMVSARTRRGHRVWEIYQLYIPESASGTNDRRYGAENPAFIDLLEEVVPMAGARRAERILTRVPGRSPLVSRSQRAGFFPLLSESLLEGRIGGGAQTHSQPSDGLHERTMQDDYSLFQLYCAATPQSVRNGLGLTFDQWQDAQDPMGPRTQQLVFRQDDKTAGLLTLGAHKGVNMGQMVSHPDYPDSLRAMVDHAMARPGFHRWLVPDHHSREKEALLRYGLQEVARYTVLIKTVAVPVMARGMAPVEA